MRVFRTKTFSRWARAEGVTDAELLRGLTEIGAGLVDARLGGGLIKKRLARSGAGKRGGYRVIVALKAKNRAVFLFGFGKNDRANISASELNALKVIATTLLAYDDEQMRKAKDSGVVSEIEPDDWEKSYSG